MNSLCFVTSGAPALSGCKNGVMGKLNARLGRRIPNFQCIIQQEVLCCKVLKINYVLKWIIEGTNFI
jgi:hypothetical protein